MPYDRKLATDLAPPLIRHLNEMVAARRKYDYSRSRVRSFQDAAGIKVDGIYAGESRGALVHFGGNVGHLAPKPFFKPTHTIPYIPREPKAVAPTYVPPPPKVAPSPPIKLPTVVRAPPPPPAVPAPVPLAVAPTPVADPMRMGTLSTQEWGKPTTAAFEELSRAPGNVGWSPPDWKLPEADKKALLVIGGGVLLFHFARKKNWL